MTARQQKALLRYLDRLRPHLGLRDWTLYVDRKPPGDESHVASCYTVPGTKYARLRFAPHFFELAATYQRETCVHELLHAVHAATQDQVRDVLAEHMPKAAHAVFRNLYFQAHEYAIDGLAVALAPLFPLPELPQ